MDFIDAKSDEQIDKALAQLQDKVAGIAHRQRRDIYRLMAQSKALIRVVIPADLPTVEAQTHIIDTLTDTVLYRVRRHLMSGLAEYQVAVCSPDAIWAMLCKAYELGAADPEFSEKIHRKFRNNVSKDAQKKHKKLTRDKLFKDRALTLLEKIECRGIGVSAALKQMKKILGDCPIEMYAELRQLLLPKFMDVFNVKEFDLPLRSELVAPKKKRKPEPGAEFSKIKQGPSTHEKIFNDDSDKIFDDDEMEPEV